MSSNPCFITRNRHGIFYYHRRLPRALLEQFPDAPALVRFSLHTKNRRDAQRAARRVSVVFDEIAQQHFASADAFAEAMQLLAAHRKYENGLPIGEAPEFNGHRFGYGDPVEQFLGFLSPDQRTLLDGAFAYDSARKQAVAYGWTSQHGATTSLGEDQATRIIDGFRDELRNQEFNGLKVATIDEAISQYLDAAETKQQWKADKNYRTKFENVYFPLLKEITGDKESRYITVEDAEKYTKVVLKFPDRRTKKYKDLQLSQIIRMKVPQSEQLSVETKRQYLGRMSSFLKWTGKHKYTIKELDFPIVDATPKKKTESHKKKEKYSKEDLAKIFNSDAYTRGKHKEDWQFWIPLIALYSGARQNEIAQLYLEDIYQYLDTGIWVFDINENDSEKTLKSIKRGEHSRFVPIHSKLIELGFLDFLETKKKQNRLWELLTYGASANKWADRVEAWYNRTFAKKCEVKSPKKSFHSFRHTFETHLYQEKDVNDHTISVLCGQTPEGKVAKKNYIKPAEMEQRKRDIDKADFSDCIDFDAMKDWKHQAFWIKKPN